jgi:protein arginine N-methyltransferase 3
MSVHLPPRPDVAADDSSENDSLSSSEEDEEEETWDDWVSDSLEQRICKSLFEEKFLSSVEEALAYDKETHGFDLNALSSKLCRLHIH